MNEIDKFSMIEKDLLQTNQMSAEALSVYVALGLYSYGKNEKIVSYGMLEDLIFKDKTDTIKRKSIINGFQELIKINVIRVIRWQKDNVFVCDISRIINKDPRKFYYSITEREYSSIMNVNEGVNIYSLLKYFVMLTGTFMAGANCNSNYKYKVGDMPQSSLSTITGVSIPTLNRYNLILEQCHLLYVARRKASVSNIESGKIFKQMSNVYSRYEHKDICDKYAKENGYQKKEKFFVDDRCEMRSLAQSYNLFVRYYKNNKCKDMNKVCKAYNAAKEWNERIYEKYYNQLSEGRKVPEPQYKDLSIFEQYDLRGFNGEN